MCTCCWGANDAAEVTLPPLDFVPIAPRSSWVEIVGAVELNSRGELHPLLDSTIVTPADVDEADDEAGFRATVGVDIAERRRVGCEFRLDELLSPGLLILRICVGDVRFSTTYPKRCPLRKSLIVLWVETHRIKLIMWG
mmetsp:Transcript_4466/g.7640  ORF Transcript_4466/g.7640 Transcript_4466/m.7640 type:complete len:139 (-) Transcript_4466:2457-2873(-)